MTKHPFSECYSLANETNGSYDDSSSEFSMPRFAVGEIVDKATDDHSPGVVVAVFSTLDGSYRYAIDTEGYGALQFVIEEKLVPHTAH